MDIFDISICFERMNRSIFFSSIQQFLSFTLGRDFLTDIANEGLDFAQLEAFIQDANGNSTDNLIQRINQSHLPETPPDSGSEPPYSPSSLGNIGILRTNTNVRSRLTNDMKHATTNNNVAIESVTQLTVSHSLINTSDIMYITNNDEINSDIHKQCTILENRSHDRCVQNNNLRDNLLELNNQRNYKENLEELPEQDNNSNIACMRSVLSTQQPQFVTKKRKLTDLSISSKSVSLAKQENCKNSNTKSYNSESGDHIFIGHDQQLQSHQNLIQNCNTVSNLQLDSISNSLDSSSSNENSDSNSVQSIRFNMFQPNSWHRLLDQNLQEL